MPKPPAAVRTAPRALSGARASFTAATAATSAPPPSQVKRRVSFVYDAGPHPLTNLVLKGSWDATTGRYSPEWNQSDVSMKPLGQGKWGASVELVDDGSPHDWQWGVVADGPTGKAQWALMGEQNLRFSLGPKTRELTYAPTTYHQMGAVKRPDGGISFRFWAPNARSVQVKVMAPSGEIERIPLQRDADGVWQTQVPGAWKRLEGKAYVYELVDSEGKLRERPDPYARQMQGEQRGIGRAYLDPATGQETQPYTPHRLELLRFEIQGHMDAAEAYLVLRDESGAIVKKDALEARIGAFDAGRIGKMRQGRFNDFWTEGVQPDGRIRMTKLDGAWSTLVNNPDAIAGLRYELQVYDRDAQGKLVLRGDKNRDGSLSNAERQSTAFNDPWDNVLSASSGKSWRGAVITSNRYQPKYQNAPRERDYRKWTVYQLHVGSFLGESFNGKRSTFEDVTKKLDYFKELGVNTLELLPTNEVEGNRDWGYIGMNSLAVESAFGFESEDGRWVSGTEALQRLIDEAHKRGLNVVNDVVYNHIGGDYNFLSQLDGPQDPYFNFSTTPGEVDRRTTPWGLMPAYTQDRARNFFVDHSVSQLDELGFDGLRFDFTQPIVSTGGEAGLEMLREINRQLHFFRPGFFTVAEHFDYDPTVTQPADRSSRGVGFDAQWYTQYQHDLVHEYNDDHPGLVQAVAEGKTAPVERFLKTLTSPRGLESYDKAYTVISNHDEVGNAARTLLVATNGKTGFPEQWARSIDKLVMVVGQTSDGVPMFFEGEESMAQNAFKWGTPSTWDLGWSWEKLGQSWDWKNLTFTDDQVALYRRLFAQDPATRAANPEYQRLSSADRQLVDDVANLPAERREQALVDVARRFKFRLTQAVLALRQSAPALSNGSMAERVYGNDKDGVLAFQRHGEDGDYLVIANAGRQAQLGYQVPLPPGRWKEVFNSDAREFGGANVGNGGAVIDGGGPRALSLPMGGALVFKRV